MNMPSCQLASLCKNWWSDWRTGLGLIFCYISERCDKDPLYMHAMEILVRPGQTLWFMEMRHNKEKRHEHATSVVICFCRQCWPHRPVSTPLPSGHFYDLWLFICKYRTHWLQRRSPWIIHFLFLRNIVTPKVKPSLFSIQIFLNQTEHTAH